MLASVFNTYNKSISREGITMTSKTTIQIVKDAEHALTSEKIDDDMAGPGSLPALRLAA